MVAWLEDLSSDRLDRDEAALQRAGGARIQFSEREGLPLNTLDSLSQRSLKAPQKLVTTLDPDAATRCLTSASSLNDISLVSSALNAPTCIAWKA